MAPDDEELRKTLKSIAASADACSWFLFIIMIILLVRGCR